MVDVNSTVLANLTYTEYFTIIDPNRTYTYDSPNIEKEEEVEIFLVDVDPDLVEDPVNETFYLNVTNNFNPAHLNIAGEPTYPKVEEGAVTFDFKLFFTLLGTVTGILALLAIVFMPKVCSTAKYLVRRFSKRFSRAKVTPDEKPYIIAINTEGLPTMDSFRRISPTSTARKHVASDFDYSIAHPTTQPPKIFSDMDLKKKGLWVSQYHTVVDKEKIRKLTTLIEDVKQMETKRRLEIRDLPSFRSHMVRKNTNFTANLNASNLSQQNRSAPFGVD